MQEDYQKVLEQNKQQDPNKESAANLEELEKSKKKFNDLLSEHIALEELNDKLNKKQENLKLD